jgi:hypothetical protein
VRNALSNILFSGFLEARKSLTISSDLLSFVSIRAGATAVTAKALALTMDRTERTQPLTKRPVADLFKPCKYIRDSFLELMNRV